MASVAQIEANRRNALMSTGPTSPDGKVSSSRNSFKHGLTAEVSDGETVYPGFDAKLAEWEAEVRPRTLGARFALRRAVGAVFRLEACRTAFDAAVVGHRTRAGEAWDEDRFAEAAALLGRLSRRPEVVAHQLRTSAHGVALLVRLWERLAEALEAKEGVWDDSEVATACDLLGIPSHLRSGRLPFDPEKAGAGLHDSRRSFVRDELARLDRRLTGPMASLDALDLNIALRGSLAMLTRPVQLILRYESAANRVFDRMLALAKSPADAEAEPGLSPLPQVRLGPLGAAPREVAFRHEAPVLEELAATGAAEFDDLTARVAPSRPAGMRVDRPAEAAPMGRAVVAAVAEPKPGRPESTSRLNRHQRRARAARARATG